MMVESENWSFKDESIVDRSVDILKYFFFIKKIEVLGLYTPTLNLPIFKL